MASAGQVDPLDDLQHTLNEVNALLANDPQNKEWLEGRELLEQQIRDATNGNVSGVTQPSPPSPPASADAPIPKWSKADHPAFRPDHQAAKPTINDVKPVDISINDVITAKWSGDGREYKAKVLSVTGSRSKPMYTVKWNVDGSTETIPGTDVKPVVTEARKRKADAPTATPAVFNPPSNPGVISAAATRNPNLPTEPRPEPSKCSDGPTRPAKKPKVIGSKKALEANKSSWQTFQSKTKVGKKTTKNDSMFRIGDGVNARVGFTGSGKPMQKDQSRGRHTYNGAEEEEQ